MRLFLRHSPTLAGLQLVALLYGAIAGAAMSQAATLVVTSTADSGAGSLRDAIGAASDGNTIQFDTALNGQTISLTSDELVVDKNITISGPGPNVLTVEGALNQFRTFHVTPAHTVVIAGLMISNGSDSGGGVFNDQATLTLNNCTVRGNQSQTTQGGGGIYNQGESAILTIVNSTVSDNFTEGGFGGNGAGIKNEGTLTMTNSVVSNNLAPTIPLANGGGIYNGGMMEITNSAISNNRAGITGGGIYNGGTLTITDSTISGNFAGTGVEGSGFGGGIDNQGTLVIRNTTVSNNNATGKGASGVGGGIYSGGQTLMITNTTVSGNFANLDAGGIYNGGTLTLTNSTVSGNTANRNGGGIYNGGPMQIGNTILNAGTSGTNIFNNGGTLTSLGYNLSSDDGAGLLTATGDQINTNALLGPLQSNGGPTFTHDLLTGSPALNAGDPNFTPPPLNDQRGPGYFRAFNGRIDIGSLEVQPAPPTPTPSATAAPTATATATPITTPTATPTPSPTTTATPAPTSTPGSSPARALNISTRLRVETGDNVMIGGFIITGNASKNVAVRGIGPSLASSGLSDVLADPTLELRAANGALILQNDDWQDDPDQAAQLSALGLAPLDPKESGIIATLTPNTYTAILAGKNNSSGIGLVEVYDTNQAADSQLANISTRGFVQTGSNVMIGGFILGGSSNNTGIIVRGLGPSLAQFGLSPLLADPTLELHDGNGTLLISNDDWQNDPMQAAQLSAHGLGLQDPKESGIFASLPPGTFTAILAGKNGSTGIGLVEIYNVQ